MDDLLQRASGFLELLQLACNRAGTELRPSAFELPLSLIEVTFPRPLTGASSLARPALSHVLTTDHA